MKEPSDSFPEEVLFDEEKDKNGKVKRKLVEPLAADVRGDNKKEVLKKIKSEKLRLIAPMYNLDYDDLKQRHKLQRQRKILITSIIIAISCLLFALYTTIMLVKINSQQNTLKLHQALSLSSKAQDYLNKDSRYEAIKSSYQALTKFNGVKMPYTSEAEYALSESLGVYNAGSSYKAISEVKTKGVIDYIKSSDDSKYVLIYDESEELSLVNAKTLKVIKSFNDINGLSMDEDSFSFVGNSIASYINNKGNVILINVKNGKVLKEIKKEGSSYTSIKGDLEGKYLLLKNEHDLYIYNVKNNKKIGKYTSKEKILDEMYFSEDYKYVFIGTKEKSYDVTKEDYITIHTIDINEIKELNNIEYNAGYIAGMLTKDNNLYLLLNRTMGADFNMIVSSYNYIDGEINWTKSFDGNFGKFIKKSYPKDTNNLAVVNYDKLKVFDMENGEMIEEFNTSSEIINIYSYYDKEVYLLFIGDGKVNYVNMQARKNIEYLGKFELNLDKYIKAIKSDKGFLLVPFNDNRAIYYEANSNKKIKEVKEEIDYAKDDSIVLSKYDKVKKEYNLKNKNLINKIFYDNKKELLFVNYTNEDLAIYNVKTKKLLKMLTNVGKVNHYFGKDKYNRIYIGDISDSYIIDKDYNKVGHIKGLSKVDKDKVIVRNSDKFYSLEIYTLDNLLQVAKEYLK